MSLLKAERLSSASFVFLNLFSRSLEKSSALKAGHCLHSNSGNSGEDQLFLVAATGTAQHLLSERKCICWRNMYKPGELGWSKAGIQATSVHGLSAPELQCQEQFPTVPASPED